MHTIEVALGKRSYLIHAGEGLLEETGRHLASLAFSRRVGIVSNPAVYSLYGEKVVASVRSAGFEPIEIILPDGEEYKNLDSLRIIYDRLLDARLDRKSALIALGGGVIGDITGFAAATYMRGIDFIQIPTTLLAQVDSSVGGKTGVNHPLGKNMIGSFWQPRVVLIDTKTLLTLPRRELLCGIAEVIKYGIILDAEFFGFLDEKRERIMGLDTEALLHVITRSCEMKAEVVSRDEREGGLRAILNFGHTVGHAVESLTGYKQYLHGEAVAIGMWTESVLASALGFLDQAGRDRINRLMQDYGFDLKIPSELSPDAMVASMLHDKKTIDGSLTFVLPRAIGEVEITHGVSQEAVLSALRGL